MSLVTCSLGLPRIIELAADIGMSAFEVVEATLVHSIAPADLPVVDNIIVSKRRMLNSMHLDGSDVQHNVQTVELFLCNLPNEVQGALSAFADLGVIHLARARANWVALQTLMAANDPVVAEVLAQAEAGDTTPTRH